MTQESVICSPSQSRVGTVTVGLPVVLESSVRMRWKDLPVHVCGTSRILQADQSVATLKGEDG